MGRRRRRPRRAPLACLTLAGLSLLVLRQPSYDPSAWLIWGRELHHGALSTVGGPSWKPLPVAFTTLFAFAGSSTAPLLWLFVARAGGFAAVPLMFRVGARLGGRAAGWVGAAALLLATDFLYNIVRGDSEGWLVALALVAIDLHLSRRHRAAFAVGLLAGLLRPEVWLVLAGYGLWLLRRDRRALTVALLAGGGVALLAAWFLPDYVTTGDWLRGASRARHPVPGSPGQSAFPFGLTFLYASIAVCWPVWVGAVDVARRDAVLRGIAAAAAALMITVAVLAQAGFTGNLRYVTLPAALVCLLGGVGLPDLARRVPRWLGAPAAVAVAVAIALIVADGTRLARDERALGPRLDAAITAAGGVGELRACGQLSTTAFERQTLAYRTGLESRQVWTHARAPGIALVRDGRQLPGARRLPLRVRLPSWWVRSSCPAPG